MIGAKIADEHLIPLPEDRIPPAFTMVAPKRLIRHATTRRNPQIHGHVPRHAAGQTGEDDFDRHRVLIDNVLASSRQPTARGTPH
jgi:hypothetical protein